MANELKPCPFCNGSAEIVEDDGWFFARCENSACPPAPQTPSVADADTAARDWNTRPAAPVEGLETVRWEVFTRDNWHSDHPQSWATRKQEGRKVRELVTRPQAETIIASKDAEIDRLQKINAMIMGDDENAPRYTTKRLKQEVERVTQVMRGEASDREAHVKTLEADNAALTARVKELENRAEVAEYKLDQAINTVQPMIIQRAERAETQLAEAEKVREAAIELNEAVNKDFNVFGAQKKLRAALEAKQ